MSPTQRSLAWLRGAGYLTAVTERWNPHAKVRQDLFGIIDILAIRPGETMGVQCTTGANMAARRRKMLESDALPQLKAAGWAVALHGWRKVGGTWEPRIEML